MKKKQREIDTNETMWTSCFCAVAVLVLLITNTGADKRVDDLYLDDSGGDMDASIIVGGVDSPAGYPNFVGDSSPDLEIDALKSLLDEMFASYNKLIRPKIDLAEPLVINTFFVPHAILQFNTQSQIFSMIGFFVFEWRDEELAQAPSFNGTLKISPDQIWLPSVRIAKSVGQSPYIGNKKSDFIGLQTNGSVQWVPEGTFRFVCEVNVQFYPFDTQTCVLTYYIEGETLETVDLQYIGTVDLGEYVENAEWGMVYAEQHTVYKDNMTFIDVYFVVARRGIFESMTVLVPPICMSMISGIPFLIPISYGEKGTISIMIFFGYTIFMTVLVHTLPHNSLHVSFLVIYTVYLLFGSIVLSVYSMLQHKIHALIQDEKFKGFGSLLPSCCHKSKNEPGTIWSSFSTKIDLYIFLFVSVMNSISTAVLISILLSYADE